MQSRKDGQKVSFLRRHRKMPRSATKPVADSMARKSTIQDGTGYMASRNAYADLVRVNIEVFQELLCPFSCGATRSPIPTI